MPTAMRDSPHVVVTVVSVSMVSVMSVVVSMMVTLVMAVCTVPMARRIAASTRKGTREGVKEELLRFRLTVLKNPRYNTSWWQGSGCNTKNHRYY